MFWKPVKPGVPQPADEWFSPRRFAALLAALLFVAYPEVILGGGTFFHRDYAVFGYPLAYHLRESLWRGEIPLWNPLNDCGLPFLAQWNTMTLYPLSLFYVLLPLAWSLGVFCLGHLFLAGMGMYFLAHRWTANRFAASAAGVAYAFSALMLHSLMWPNNIAALGWLPWVVLAAERAWRDGGRWLPLAALAGAMQMLSGAPEVILLTWLLVGTSLAGQFLLAPASARWRMSARFLLVVTWVAGLAAAQLLAFLDLLVHSQRDKSFADSLWSMPIWGWANLLVPLYRSYPTSLGIYAQPDQYWIPSYYLGVGVLALALLAVGQVRRPRTWLLGAVTVFCLLMALGKHGLVYSVLKQILPGLGFIRFPIKFVLLPVFLVPLLAAFGVAQCLRVSASGWPRQRRIIVTLGGVLLVVIAGLIGSAFGFPLKGASSSVAAISGATRAIFLVLILGGIVALRQTNRPTLEKVARVALLFFLWLDAMTAGPRPNPTAPLWVYTPNLARKELRFDPAPATGLARVMLNAEAEANLMSAPLSNAVDEVVYNRLALYGNANLLDTVPKVVGMYSLYFRESGDVFGALLSSNQPPAGLADFLGVAHINERGKATHWDPRPNHLAWVTGGQRPVFADPSETIAALADSQFDPRQTVFLPSETRAKLRVTNASEVKISVRRFAAHEVEMEVEAAEPALVVVAQSYYHNWHAYVGGQSTPLLRANHAFQALEIPAGRSEVRLAYEDCPFHVGIAISSISAAALVVARMRSRRRPPA